MRAFWVDDCDCKRRKLDDSEQSLTLQFGSASSSSLSYTLPEQSLSYSRPELEEQTSTSSSTASQHSRLAPEVLLSYLQPEVDPQQSGSRPTASQSGSCLMASQPYKPATRWQSPYCSGFSYGYPHNLLFGMMALYNAEQEKAPQEVRDWYQSLSLLERDFNYCRWIDAMMERAGLSFETWQYPRLGESGPVFGGPWLIEDNRPSMMWPTMEGLKWP